MFILLQGCQLIKQNCSFLLRSDHITRCVRQSINFTCSSNLRSCLLSYAINYRTSHCFSASRNIFERNPLLTSSVCGRRGLFVSDHRPVHWARSRIYASIDVASAVDVINDLGLDTLTFLIVTVIVVPVFRIIKASPVSIKLAPQLILTMSIIFCLLTFGVQICNHANIFYDYFCQILGFFFAGVILNQFGLIRNLTDVKVLSEWGILFLVRFLACLCSYCPLTKKWYLTIISFETRCFSNLGCSCIRTSVLNYVLILHHFNWKEMSLEIVAHLSFSMFMLW